MNNTEKIEYIESRLKQLNLELRDNQQIYSDLGKKNKTVQKEIATLKQQLAQLKNPTSLEVSDHAIVRYLERYRGVNIEEIRTLIKEKLKGAENLGELRTQGFVISNGMVVTYAPMTAPNNTERAINGK